MYTLIIIADDADKITKFQQSDDPEEIRTYLAEWTLQAIGAGKELEQLEISEEEVKGMNFEELADFTGDYCWGENNIKRVHVLKSTEEGFEIII